MVVEAKNWIVSALDGGEAGSIGSNLPAVMAHGVRMKLGGSRESARTIVLEQDLVGGRDDNAEAGKVGR